MTRALHVPSEPGQISDTKHRVHTLERRLRGGQPTVPGYVVKYSLPGAVIIAESGKEFHPTGGRLFLVYAALLVAGTTATVLSLRKNGTEFDRLTLVAGADYNELSVSMQFAARSDDVRVAVVEAGANAESLTVFGQFDR